MKLTLVFLFCGLSLSAQVDLKSLSGKWDVQSFIKNGETKKVDHLAFSINDTDLGDFVLVQTYYDPESGACEWIVQLTIKGGNKIEHDLLIDEPGCKCSMEGEYTYQLKDGILTISNGKDKLVLYRKS